MRCKHLVLDSGPLLSLSPLRGLADAYFTVPEVLDELKDKRAREHVQQLALSAGVQVDIRNPDPTSLTQVIQFAKKTGDYAVLSHADICVLALTHTLQREEDARLERRKQDSPSDAHVPADLEASSSACPQVIEGQDMDDLSCATQDLSLESGSDDLFVKIDPSGSSGHPAATVTTATPLYEDPSTDEDDGMGEWITPDNVALHKSRARELLPSSDSGTKQRCRAGDEEIVLAGCMTADFAMQNVLFQMGLALIGTEGKRIQKVKTWVLRCHACFKICKDNSKQFCPSCGNPTLMRASVTLSSPNASADAPVMELHLKKNFQYKLRGTKYAIPAPRPGSAKVGSGEGLILREDQLQYMRAKQRIDGKRERDEQRMLKGLADGGVTVGSWSDLDWIPGMLGGSTKARTRGKDGMPQIGYGKKNPNERRKY